MSAPLPAWQFRDRAGKVFSCSWCQGNLGVTPQVGENHGICREHAREFMAGLGLALERDADGVARPVAIQIRKEQAA